MQIDTRQPDKVVNFCGLRCPHLLITTIRTLTPLASGQILQLTADDPNAPLNISAWCDQSGHELLNLVTENGRFTFTIKHL